jgi:hypothetical protein
VTIEHSIWSKFVTARKRRIVGNALRTMGYDITNDKIAELGYVSNIGRYLEPADTDARVALYERICEAAGYKPVQKG